MKALRTRLLAILGVTIILGLLASSCASSSASRVGQFAPDFTLPTLNGETVSLSDFRGQPVLLNFWASWCGPCRYEMPFLQAVHEQERYLVVLAINIGEGSTTVRNFMESLGLTFTVPLDERGNVANRYEVSGIPTTLLVDREGIIRFKKVGAFTGESDVRSALKTIMQTEG